MMDVDQHLFMEMGCRGGFAGAGSLRYSKANNPYMQENFDPQKLISYIMNYDFNALYASELCEMLPVEIIGFLSETLRSIFTKDHIMSLSEDSEFGYHLEVNLSYPDDKHDYFN